jgi:hypothetical protein
MLILILIATLFLIAWAYYWAFKTPEEVFAPGKKRRVIQLIVGVGIAIAVIGMFSSEHAYSALFFAYPPIYAVLLRRRVRAVLAGAARRFLALFGALILLLWPKELFVVGDGPDPLVGHMVFYFGFYIGLALGMAALYRHWHYTPAQAYVIGGLWGVLVEQNFAAPALLFSGQIVGFLWFAPFVFAVYGLYLAGPTLLFYEEFQSVTATHRRQRLILWVTVVVLPLVCWLLWAALINALGMDTSGMT